LLCQKRHGTLARLFSVSGPRSQATLQQSIKQARGLSRGPLGHQSSRETLLPCPQCRLGKGEMDQVALGKATSAAMRDVAYACQPADALRIGFAGEGTQRFTKRDCECLLRNGRRAARRLIARELFRQLFGSAGASSRRERHHGVHKEKGPRIRECL